MEANVFAPGTSVRVGVETCGSVDGCDCCRICFHDVSMFVDGVQVIAAGMRDDPPWRHSDHAVHHDCTSLGYTGRRPRSGEQE